MTLQDHRYLLQRGVACTLTDTVDGHLHLTGTSHHTVEGVGRRHAQVVVAMGGDDGTVNTVDMLLQILDLLEILLWQAVARGIRDIHHRGPSLDHGLHHLCQILIVRTACILAVELHIVNKALGILRSSHGPLENLLTGGVEFVLNVLVRGADTRVDTLVLGILQRIEGHVDIFLYGTCQRTDHGPCHGLRDLNHRVEITRTRNGESCFDHVHAQLLQRLGHLNLLYGVQLTSWHLFAVTQCCVENKQSVIHRLVFCL